PFAPLAAASVIRTLALHDALPILGQSASAGTSVTLNPGCPIAPSLPSTPSTPSIPTAPFLPSAPSAPSEPSTPSLPSLPSTPSTDRKSTRLHSSHVKTSYAVFCLQ